MAILVPFPYEKNNNYNTFYHKKVLLAFLFDNKVCFVHKSLFYTKQL